MAGGAPVRIAWAFRREGASLKAAPDQLSACRMREDLGAVGKGGPQFPERTTLEVAAYDAGPA